MTGTALFFVIIGVCVAAENLMKVVDWLDTPHEAPRRARRPVSVEARESDDALALPCAELALESALYAA